MRHPRVVASGRALDSVRAEDGNFRPVAHARFLLAVTLTLDCLNIAAVALECIRVTRAQQLGAHPPVATPSEHEEGERDERQPPHFGRRTKKCGPQKLHSPGFNTRYSTVPGYCKVYQYTLFSKSGDDDSALLI